MLDNGNACLFHCRNLSQYLKKLFKLKEKQSEILYSPENTKESDICC